VRFVVTMTQIYNQCPSPVTIVFAWGVISNILM
jgi:hypothetical protein